MPSKMLTKHTLILHGLLCILHSCFFLCQFSHFQPRQSRPTRGPPPAARVVCRQARAAVGGADCRGGPRAPDTRHFKRLLSAGGVGRQQQQQQEPMERLHCEQSVGGRKRSVLPRLYGGHCCYVGLHTRGGDGLGCVGRGVDCLSSQRLATENTAILLLFSLAPVFSSTAPVGTTTTGGRCHVDNINIARTGIVLALVLSVLLRPV